MQLLRAFLVLASFEIILAGAYAISGAFPLDPRIAYACAFTMVAASAVAVGCTMPVPSARSLVWLVLPCAMLWVVGSAQGSGLLAALAVTAALLAGASLVGGVVGGLIEHPGQLLFVAIVSGAADVASVFHPTGPSATIADTPAALALIALPWPMLGTGELQPLLGAGDVVFTALYLTSSKRHGMSVGRTALALMAAYVAAMSLVLLLERVVPVLPLLGLAVVLAQPRARTPSERDRKRGYVIAGLVVVMVAVLLLRR